MAEPEQTGRRVGVAVLTVVLVAIELFVGVLGLGNTAVCACNATGLTVALILLSVALVLTLFGASWGRGRSALFIASGVLVTVAFLAILVDEPASI